MCASLTDVLSQNGGIPPGECFPLKGSHLHTKKMPRGQYATASTVVGGGGEGGEGGGEGGGRGGGRGAGKVIFAPDLFIPVL